MELGLERVRRDLTVLKEHCGSSSEFCRFARNRKNKCYNFRLYEPAPKLKLSSEDHVESGLRDTEPPTEAPGVGIMEAAQNHTGERSD